MGRQVAKLLEAQKIDMLRKTIKRIFDDSAVKGMVGKMSDEEMLDFARHYEKGVFMATPPSTSRLWIKWYCPSVTSTGTKV